MAVIFTALETVCDPCRKLPLISNANFEQTIPLYVMETFGWSSSGAGLIFIASSVPSFAGVYIGKAIPRLGIRILGTAAFLLASSCWILMRLVESYTTLHIILLISLLLLLGLAIVTIEVVSMTEVFQVIEDFELEFPGAFGEKSPVAQAYALFNMAFAGGQLLGPILAGGMRVHAGWSAMTLVLGALCGVTALPIALFGGANWQAGQVESEGEA
jgi:MFS family permease